MSMELHFLGTASAYPSCLRAASCIVLRHQNGCWMFDCGEGSQIQITRSAVKPGRINKIFITHLHGDHVFGLPGFLCTLGLNCANDKGTLEVYGPVGLRKYLRTNLELSGSHLGFSYVVHELSHSDSKARTTMSESQESESSATTELHPNELPGRAICPDKNGLWEVYHDDMVTVIAAPLKHRITCFGYVIIEKDLSGKLDASLLKQKGIPPGPLYAKIKDGEKVVAADGTIILPEDVLGKPRPGRKLVILGDTCDSSQIMAAALNADIIVHEATLEDDMEEKAVEQGHSTPRMAGIFARSVKAKKLILTHFSQRYSESKEDNKCKEDISRLVMQAKHAFGSDKVIAAEDFLVVILPMPK